MPQPRQSHRPLSPPAKQVQSSPIFRFRPRAVRPQPGVRGAVANPVQALAFRARRRGTPAATNVPDAGRRSQARALRACGCGVTRSECIRDVRRVHAPAHAPVDRVRTPTPVLSTRFTRCQSAHNDWMPQFLASLYEHFRIWLDQRTRRRESLRFHRLTLRAARRLR